MKKVLFIFLFVGFGIIRSTAQYFEDYELNYIRIFCDTLISQLDRYSDFTTDGIAIEESYIDSFINLFADEFQSKIYNDLTRKPRYLTPMDYVDIVRDKFPHGLQNKYLMDSARFLLPKQINDTTFFVNILIPKYVVGMNSDNKIVGNYYEVYLTVSFNYKKYEFNNFKISKIDDYQLILKKNSDKQMRGLYIGLSGMAFNSDFILSQPALTYIHSAKMYPGYALGTVFTLFFNSHFNLSFGSYLFQETFYSNNIFDNFNENNIQKTDIDGDNYYLYLKYNLNEKISNLIVLAPVSIGWRTGLYNKIGLSISAGVNIRYMLRSQVSVSGESQRAGYYPQYHLLLTDVAYYGFGTRNYNDTYAMQWNKISYSGFASVGLSFPIRKGKAYFVPKLFYNQTFMDLGYKQSAYPDDYISLFGPPAMAYIRNYGIILTYKIKL